MEGKQKMPPQQITTPAVYPDPSGSTTGDQQVKCAKRTQFQNPTNHHNTFTRRELREVFIVPNQKNKPKRTQFDIPIHRDVTKLRTAAKRPYSLEETATGGIIPVILVKMTLRILLWQF